MCWHDGMSNVCAENLMKSSNLLRQKLFSTKLNMNQVHEETDNLWGIKMSLFLMLRQWLGRNALFKNRRSHFFGVNLELSWNDDALIRLDGLLSAGGNPNLLLIGQPTNQDEHQKVPGTTVTLLLHSFLSFLWYVSQLSYYSGLR